MDVDNRKLSDSIRHRDRATSVLAAARKWMVGAFALSILALAIALGGQCCLAATTERAPTRDPQRIIQPRVWSYKELRERQIVMQKQDYSCGAAALATIIRYYWGDKATEEEFLKILAQILTAKELEDREKNGLALTDLRKLANKAGYQAAMGTVSFQQLTEAKVPVVVGIKVEGHEHFAVFRGSDGEWVYLADPIRGNIRVQVPHFVKQWQKNAILAVAKPNVPVKKVNPMAVRSSEVIRGWLNYQTIRRNPLMPVPPNPLPLIR